MTRNSYGATATATPAMAGSVKSPTNPLFSGSYQSYDAADSQSFALAIHDVGHASGAPAMIRLRRLLKSMLRQFGFRCKHISPECSSLLSAPDEPHESEPKNIGGMRLAGVGGDGSHIAPRGAAGRHSPERAPVAAVSILEGRQ